jgi:recombination protein RecA
MSAEAVTTPNATRKDLAKQITQKTRAQFGVQHAYTGRETGDIPLGVTSFGILALDYMSGIGGVPEGFPIEVFGIPDIGKSAVIGLSVIREGQKAGKMPGIIAMEPSFDYEWAEKHGVDTDELVIAYPDSGEEAFAILYSWVKEGVPDLIVFDSIGGISTQGNSAEEGKPKAYGASGTISAGLTNCAPFLFKNKVSLVLLNQVRDDTNSRMAGQLDSPGGWALRHTCPLRIQLRPGKPFKGKVKGIDGSDDVTVGRQIIATIKRNKLAEESAPGWKAIFDFYYKETDGQFGLDVAEDVKNTAILAQVITSKGAWLYHPAFPKGKINGKEKLTKWIKENPDGVEQIRKEVLAKMNGGKQPVVPTLEEVQND